MRKLLAVAAFLACMMGLVVVPAMSKPVPTTFTVPTWTYQQQWRAFDPSANPGGPFGHWSFWNSYYSDTDYVYTLQGKQLNTTISYAPYVSNQKGGDVQYKFDKKSGFWIQERTVISYDYAKYGDYRVTNYFKGYLAFYNGMPSETTFVHGVMYQWIYIDAKKSDTGVFDKTPHAVWDKEAHAWLVGFSIYLYDRASTDYSWVPFPDPFPELHPEDIYNPLSL